MKKIIKKVYIHEVIVSVILLINTIILLGMYNTISYEQVPINQTTLAQATPKSSYSVIIQHNPFIGYIYLGCGFVLIFSVLYRVIKLKNKFLVYNIKKILSKHLKKRGRECTAPIILPEINKKNENVIIFGKPGSGKCHHPWDCLKMCLCGCDERPLIMYDEENLYYCGGATAPVFVVCTTCGRHTKCMPIADAIEAWNKNIYTKTQIKSICKNGGK